MQFKALLNFLLQYVFISCMYIPCSCMFPLSPVPLQCGLSDIINFSCANLEKKLNTAKKDKTHQRNIIIGIDNVISFAKAHKRWKKVAFHNNAVHAYGGTPN